MRVMVALVTAFLIACGGPAFSLAQEASPAADQEMPEGVSFSVLAQGVTDQGEPGPLQVGLVRITVLSGAQFPIYPGSEAALVLVESGTFTFRLTTEMSAAPDDASGSPAAAGTSASGGELSLARGESVVIPASAEGEVRNGSAEPVVAVALFAGPSATELATPGPATTGIAEEEMAGITFESLGYGISEAMPAGPLEMAIVRMTVAPGVVLPPRPYSGPDVGIMETGSFTFQTIEGPGTTIVRATTQLATPWADLTVETTGPGLDVTADAGDGFFVPAGSLTGGTAVSDTAVSVLFGALAPLGEAGATPEA